VTINRVKTDNGNGYNFHFFLTACHSLVAKPIKTKTLHPAHQRQG
jgi:hypothetical protein